MNLFNGIPKDAVHLVGCSAKKKHNAIEAGELYEGDLFKKTIALLKQREAEWHILSAEHGLVSPRQTIEPYDTQMPTGEFNRGFWAGNTFRDLLEINLIPGDTIVFWAGRAYRDGLKEILERYGFTVLCPLSGLGIGEQKKALKDALELEACHG